MAIPATHLEIPIAVLDSARLTLEELRTELAVHLLEDGRDLRTVQKLLSHEEMATATIYAHVLNRGLAGDRATADQSAVAPVSCRSAEDSPGIPINEGIRV